MRPSKRAHTAPLLTAGLALAALAACGGDARLEQLSAGIDRDSTLKIIGRGATSDTGLPNVHRREEYLANGHMLEVLFYSPEAPQAGDGVDAGRLTPIVLQDGALVTWDWGGYDSVATAHSIERTITRGK